MSKIASLVCIVLGLCILVIWFYPLYYINKIFSHVYPPEPVFAEVIETLRYIPRDFFRTPWSFVAVIGLVLIGLGISCLVRPLLRSQENEEEEG
jgi:hypothetical protein